MAFSVPQDKKSLQQYLGMIGFGTIIPNCADTAYPLHELLHQECTWNCSSVHEVAFKTLAQAIVVATPLRVPNLNVPLVPQTDASEYGIGAVLLQEHNGALHPVAFTSHTQTGVERSCTATEKEYLAIMFGLRKIDMYLDGATFTIQTDHQALTWSKNPSDVLLVGPRATGIRFLD